MSIKACYRRLELPPTATASEIRQAYKKLVRNWHPDKFEADSPMKAYAEERLKLINAAYDRIRKHQSLRPPQSGIDKNSRTKRAPQSTACPKHRSQYGNGGEWLKFINRMVLSLKRILYSPHSTCTKIDPMRRHDKSNQQIRKPFKRVLKDLKSSRPREIIGEKVRGSGFGTIYRLRQNYGPCRSKRVDSISDVAAVHQNQRIEPISRITPIKKVE